MVFDLIGSLGEEEVTSPFLPEEWDENRGMGKGGMVNHLSFSLGEDFLHRINEIFLGVSHFNRPLGLYTAGFTDPPSS